MALPGHERHEQVLAQGELTRVGGGAVGDDRPGGHLVALADDGLLVDAGALVGALELVEAVLPAVAADGAHHHVVGRDLLDHPGLLGQDHVPGVVRRPPLEPRADQRRLAAHERHRLLLHVGAHERPVGVVVLDEGDQGRRDRDDLLRRDVHVVHLAGGDEVDVAALAAHQHVVLAETAVGSERGVGLGDDMAVLLVGGQVVDRLGDPAVVHPAVGGLDEAELVDARVGGEGADQADVRALGGLSGSGARPGPRTRPAPATGRPARAPRGAAGGSAR